MTTKWLRVTTTDYYQRWETLGRASDPRGYSNPKESPGTELVVCWPDGAESREVLCVRLGRDRMQIDMNNYPDEFATQYLFIRKELGGVSVEVPLAKVRFRVVEGGV